MTKMTIYTKGTFKIVENPAIVEKFLLTEQSAIVRFYCILESYPLRGQILGSGAPVLNAVGASGAINGMKR